MMHHIGPAIGGALPDADCGTTDDGTTEPWPERLTQEWNDVDCLTCLLLHPAATVRRTATKALQISHALPISRTPNDVEAWLRR